MLNRGNKSSTLKEQICSLSMREWDQIINKGPLNYFKEFFPRHQTPIKPNFHEGWTHVLQKNFVKWRETNFSNE